MHSKFQQAKTRFVIAASISVVGTVLLLFYFYGSYQNLTTIRSISKHFSHRSLEESETINLKRKSLTDWIGLLEEISTAKGTEGRIETERIGCREYDAGAQSCVFEGISCVNVVDDGNVKLKSTDNAINPVVWLTNDNFRAGSAIPGDDWCDFRHQSADPRYFGPRHWPIRNGTIAPQWSCMKGVYMPGSYVKKVETAGRARWVESMSLVNLDYRKNNHNNHLLKDLVYLLDTALWVESLKAKRGPTGIRTDGRRGVDLFETAVKHVFLPQSENDFESQTSRDVNRLNYAIILREDLKKLYPNSSQASLKEPTKDRYTAKLFDAFPEWKRENKLMFWGKMRKDETVDLVCTSRLTVGSKLGNTGHERVCREIRQKGWELFGIAPPPMVRVGQIYYNQPPRRIMVLQRHMHRRIGNLQDLMTKLQVEFGKDVEIEMVSTSDLKTAEDHVRIFSRAGVLITPHGSQAMGQMWMPRHATLIEVMPVGYTDFAFNLMAENCKIWYDEIQSVPNPNSTVAEYKSLCAQKVPHLLNPCTAVKDKDVFVPLDAAARVIKLALERMGHPVGKWLE